MPILRVKLEVALLLALGFPVASWAQEAVSRTGARLVLEIPSEDEATVYLQRPVGATRFENGVVAVADGMGQTVHYFGPDGRFQRSVGRAGEGPGEFSTPGWIARCDVNIATVWDFSLMRLTRLDETGSILDQVQLRNVVDLPRPPARMACNRAGRMFALLRLMGERIDGDEVSVLTAPLYGFSPPEEARLIDPRTPVIQWLNAERVYQPVSPTTYFAASETLLFTAHSDSTRVVVRDLEGNVLNEWPIDLVRRPPTDEHVRRDAETQTAFISGAAARAQVTERIMGLPRPSFLPLFSGLHVDEESRVWLVLSFPGDSTTVIRAYDADGRRLGELEIPAGIEVYEIGGGHVIGGRENPNTLEPTVMVFSFDLGR
jgi:hypothetical protein